MSSKRLNLSNDERSWVLNEYLITKNAEAVRRNWTEKFGTPAPSCRIIYRIRDEANVDDARKSGRPKFACVEEKRRLSTKERSWVLNEHLKTENAETVRRRWHAKFGTPPPSRKTIYRIRDKAMVTGSVANAEIPGRPKSVCTEENRRRIAEALKDDPGKSNRKIAKDLGISRSSAARMMMDSKTYQL